MTPTALLKKIYRHDNSVWDDAHGLSRFELPDGLTDAQQALLTENRLLPNSFESFTHDTGLQAALALHDHPNFTLAHATRLFLDALGGGPLIGLSAVLNYLGMRALALHPFKGDRHCEICDFPANWTHDRTHETFTAMLGHSGNELTYRHLPVAQRQLSMEPADLRAGKAVFLSLLDVIEDAPEAESPSKLQKRVAQAKLLPVRDKYAQYGILVTLADCGILPQSAMPPAIDRAVTRAELWEIARQNPGNPRSDITLPLSAWRGANGVDRDRAATLLDAAT